MTDSLIRFAKETDASGMLEIYAPIVSDTATSFEMEPQSVEEFAQRIKQTIEKTPWLVCEIDGQVCGYAYATTFRARAAYQYSAEVSAYVHPDHHRKGIGLALYRTLFKFLEAQGYHTALAGITLPNQASVKLHESLGFAPVGVYHNVGYKFSKWHDVGWWERKLQEYTYSPLPLKDLQDVLTTFQFE